MTDTRPSNPTGAVVEKIDEMVESGSLTTRQGQSLMLTVFREGMIVMGNIQMQVGELQDAYVRFTNKVSKAQEVEEENRKALEDIKPKIRDYDRTMRWIGYVLTAVLVAILIDLLKRFI